MAVGLLIVLSALGGDPEDTTTSETAASGEEPASPTPEPEREESPEPVVEEPPLSELEEWIADVDLDGVDDCDELAALDGAASDLAADDGSDADVLSDFERDLFARIDDVCAEPEPEPEKPKFRKRDYADLTAREFSKIARDPDGHIGEQVLVFGEVFQFDSRTGTDQFLANVDGDRDSEGEELGIVSYDHTAVLGEGEFPRASFADVVEGDHFVAYATVLGSFDYDTAIGGSNTATMFLVDRIEVLGQVD